MGLLYGIDDIEAGIAKLYASRSKDVVRTDRIRCCIRGCNEWIHKRKRGERSSPNSFCPKHGISVSTSPTYVYESLWCNLIVQPDLVKKLDKVETWRLGNEKS